MKRHLPIVQSLVLVLSWLSFAPPATADDDEEKPEIPLHFDNLQWGCSARCVARDAKGALLCLDGHESLSCNQCAGAWVEAPVDVGIRTARWLELQSCGKMEPQRFPANLATLNRRLKGAVEVQPAFTHEDWVVPPTTTPVQLHDDDVAVEIAADTITVTTPDGRKLTAPWRKAAQPEEGEQLLLRLHAFGDGYLGPLTLKHPEYLMERSVWLAFVATPAVPAGGPDVAVITPMIARWLEAFCAGKLADADWSALEKAAAAGTVSPDGLMALFNAHGALHGYAFKRELWLNDFFYANDLLPRECRTRIRTYPNPKAVPAPYGKDRDRLRALWQKHRR